jgi:hypothetical protein
MLEYNMSGIVFNFANVFNPFSLCDNSHDRVHTVQLYCGADVRTGLFLL